MQDDYFIKPKRFGWLKMLIVKTFGKKFVSTDHHIAITMYLFRGEIYVTGIRETKEVIKDELQRP